MRHQSLRRGVSIASALAAFSFATAAWPATFPYLDEVEWNPGSYALALTPGGATVETLDVSGGPLVELRLTGDVGETLDLVSPTDISEIWAPSPSWTPGSPFAFVVDVRSSDVTSVTWDATAYPYLTVFPSEFGGGLAAGSAPGRDGDLFSFYGSGSIIIDLDLPEPSTWVMLVLGFAGLAWTARGHRRRIAATRASG